MDLIDRQAVIDEIDEWIKAFRENGHKESAADACLIQDGIIQLPSAQPEQHYDEWCTDCKEYDKERHCCPRWNMVIRKTLNDAQPEPQWIPCSERLPSKADHKDNMVLVCYGNGSVRFNTYMNGWVQGNPVAWMPLPESYKGE